ncbi:efflux RND transporter periplasmic adaptor subunit [Moritella sp. Urea-trap-13]|uniref:efflux RND transporter periplasmic adaptor subunit n=1 Tax=Moritella sp. Urea-trap-13 TaxID=2058327 RepID=UPI000C33A9D1|nr:efflux RND transporter periplasmic adaptor subunit [Moritella sp. Urea-trap-13]PKH06049.1 efflux RND transporter periplasmic adaptor subunit [Moritella sp. Urea-trap-13]
MKGIMATAVITGLLLSGCSEEQVVIPEPDSRPVKLQAVDVGIKDTFRTFPGVVEAGDKAVLAFRVSGVISSMDVNPGENVVKGQKLASLNQDEFSLQVEQAQANYELASVQFKRDEKLRKTNVVSELAFDTSKAKRNQAQATLSKQESNLSYATLVAPYDGTLSLSLKENHEYVMAKEAVVHIQRAGIINVTFQLPEQLLARFNNDYSRSPTVIFDTIPGEEFPAQFKEIDTEANATNSSYKVTLFMERPEGKNILPGMAGAVRIALPKGNAGALSPQALMKKGDTYYVWQIDDQGIAHKREIELDEHGRVSKGLNDGDNVAISGVKELREGQKVRSWIKERGL